jgi:hypothetical protein
MEARFVPSFRVFVNEQISGLPHPALPDPEWSGATGGRFRTAAHRAMSIQRSHGERHVPQAFCCKNLERPTESVFTAQWTGSKGSGKTLPDTTRPSFDRERARPGEPFMTRSAEACRDLKG